MPERMKIVLDTNCLLASLSRHGEYYPVWKGLQTGEYVLCLSNDILMEYEEIIGLKTSPEVAKNVVPQIATKLLTGRMLLILRILRPAMPSLSRLCLAR